MKPQRPPDQLGALLRAALAEDDEAVASWKSVEPLLELDTVSGDEYDALCLVGSRLRRLGATGVDQARIAGIARHTWAANQPVFAAAFTAAERQRVVIGRWATIAHLPEGWVLPAGTPPGTPPGANRWAGPTVERCLAGRNVLVPTRAAQLVWALTGCRWVDAACLLSLDPLPADVAAEAARLRRGIAVRDGFALLANLLGPSVVTAARTPTITVGPVLAARERFWTAAYAVTSLARIRTRCASNA